MAALAYPYLRGAAGGAALRGPTAPLPPPPRHHTHSTQHTPLPPRRYLHLNRLHDPPPPADAARLRTLLARFLRLRRVFDLSDFLTGWFLEVPLASIPLGNVLEFVAYGFHAKVSWRGCSGRRSSQGSGRRGFRDCGCPNPWPTSV
jgi:hypothetical protein